jgi:hypothetical protein
MRVRVEPNEERQSESDHRWDGLILCSCLGGAVVLADAAATVYYMYAKPKLSSLAPTAPISEPEQVTVEVQFDPERSGYTSGTYQT